MTAPTFAGFLADLLLKNVREHRLVVWFDPDRACEPFLNVIDLREAMLARYDGSLLALRRAVADRMTRDAPPDVVLWVPLAEPDTDDLLTPYTALGVILAPGQQPWQRNTAPATLTARFLRSSGMGADGVEDCRRRVESGQLALTDLDNLVAQPQPSPPPDLLANAFGTADPAAITLRFLTDTSVDAVLVARGLLPDLVELVSSVYGAERLPGGDTVQLRQALARHLLVTGLVHDLGETPPSLTAVPRATDTNKIAACLALLDDWLWAGGDRGETYVDAAREVERELGIEQLALPFETLARTARFATLERRLLIAAAARLASGAEAAVESLARVRRDSLHATRDPNLRTGWTLLDVVAGFLGRVAAPTPITADAPAAVREYAATGAAIDRDYRRIEHLLTRLDPSDAELTTSLNTLVLTIRDRYVRVTGSRAEAWTSAFAGARWRVPGFLHQTRVFADRVVPALEVDRTGYILVDALRYEMGQELAERIATDGTTVDLVPAIAALPTLTPVGMGALLPRAETGFAISDSAPLAVSIHGERLTTRADRMAYLARALGVPVVAVNASDLLPEPRADLARRLTDARLVVVTIQDIDELGESDNIGAARRYMDDVTRQIRNAVRALGHVGCRTVVIAADHGHLFAEALGTEMKIDPPSGDPVALHRRVWIGHAPSTVPGCIVIPGPAFAAANPDLSLVAPVGLGIFKVQGGGRAYFHGGTALEEVVIPVLTVTMAPGDEQGGGGEIIWSIGVGTGAIRSRVGTVEVRGRLTTLAGPVPRMAVRVEVRHGGEVIGTSFRAAYGYDDMAHEVVLTESPANSLEYIPNTIYVQVTGPAIEGLVEILLIDAGTGRVLASVADVPIAMLQ